MRRGLALPDVREVLSNGASPRCQVLFKLFSPLVEEYKRRDIAKDSRR